MTRCRAAGLLLGLLLSLAARPASAQVPAPPPEAAPVFEVIAPTVSPVCGNALLAIALGPGLVNGQLGGALPINLLLPAFGPVVEICGAVPAPPARLTCDADQTVADTINTLAGAAIGSPLPFGVNVFGIAAEQVIVIQDLLPLPANATDVRDQVVATLNCRAAPAPADAPPDAVEASTDEVNQPDELTDLALPGLIADLPTLDTTEPIESGAAAPLPVAPVAEVGGPGFAYPVVFALPLVLLIIGGYLGRALTRPVGPPQR
jgi:hypothetical protein